MFLVDGAFYEFGGELFMKNLMKCNVMLLDAIAL
jgi:hypothetical protein